MLPVPKSINVNILIAGIKSKYADFERVLNLCLNKEDRSNPYLIKYIDDCVQSGLFLNGNRHWVHRADIRSAIITLRGVV